MTFDALRPRTDGDARSPIDAARLAAANINPATGLANDYLNHFNEAIMLLELVATMPDCVDDLLAWRPMTYCEHFTASSLKHRDLAIAAYGDADPTARRQLDKLTYSMNAILVATQDALRLPAPAVAAQALAATRLLRPLVARAGAVINGGEGGSTDTTLGAPQAAVDALMER